MINIKEVNCIKTITEHTSFNSLLLLKNNKIASCSADNTIRIYDPSNDYHCDQVLKRHSKGVSSICELDDGTIVSCSSSEKSIMIGDYTIKNAHDDEIYLVISLPNNRIASCSRDTIKIWNGAPPYSDTPIKVLEQYNEFFGGLLYIKERYNGIRI